MRRNVLASAASLALAFTSSQIASAADLPVKAPPMVRSNWSGCYMGVNVGYGQARYRQSNVTATPAPAIPVNAAFADFSFSESGVVGGGQGGCNWQSGSYVWGLETDLQGAGLDGSKHYQASIFEFPQAGAFNTDVKSTLHYFGTVRGRVGWTPTPTTLLYLTGGLAYGRVSSSLCFPPVATGVCGTFQNSDTHNHLGYTVGVGGEIKLPGNFTGKLEYLYGDLGTKTYNFLNIAGVDYHWKARVEYQTVRVGINYMFANH